MKTVWRLGLSVALAAASSAAWAFEEQKGGAAPTTSAPAAADPAPQGDPGAVNLNTDTAKGAEGTEIRLPGLGKVGVLPKMDFGLELLYGADPKPSDAPAEQSADDDELKIRGSLKHNF